MCIDDTLGRAGLMANTTCLSVRAMGTVLQELTDNAIELWLAVGDVGVPGTESSEININGFYHEIDSFAMLAVFQIYLLMCWQ